MASVTDISETARAPLPSSQATSASDFRSVLIEGGQQPSSRPMLWGSIPKIEAVHSASRPVPNIEVFFVKDADVGGKGSTVKRGNSYFWAQSVYPSYIRDYYHDNVTPDRWGFLTDLTRVDVEAIISVMHFNYGYGHWLTEIFPKLFLIRMLNEEGIFAPLAWPITAHAHLRKRTEEFLPGQEFLDYNPSTQYIHARTAILPGSGSHDHFFHPVMRSWFQGLASSARRRDRTLFISRRDITYNYGFRRLVNFDELEGVAESLGAEVYCPEKYSASDQIRHYAEADLIVGEYGSGLHNTMFSPAGATVVALNWINSVQSRICNLMDQRVGYVLAPDNQPRLFRSDWLVTEYSIDADLFRSRLRNAIDIQLV